MRSRPCSVTPPPAWPAVLGASSWRVVQPLSPGGQRRAERDLGWSRVTSRQGTHELTSGVTWAPAFTARGRERAADQLPHLREDIRAIVARQRQADPQFRSNRLYTRLSAAEVRRQLIRQKPYTDAEVPTEETIRGKLNALGYTLADRTNRFDEAKQYLEQAIKLAPNDAFILDSLGWLQYRMKEHAQAISTLRRALSVRADPEIAAHLGEVLWESGDPQEAKKIWDSALKDNPEHDALLNTIQKYKAQ